MILLFLLLLVITQLCFVIVFLAQRQVNETFVDMFGQTADDLQGLRIRSEAAQQALDALRGQLESLLTQPPEEERTE